MAALLRHPLDALSIAETELARNIILKAHPAAVIFFREIFLQEPAKAELQAYLELEHACKLNARSQKPARQAIAMFDIIGTGKAPVYCESIVDLDQKAVAEHKVVDTTRFQPTLTLWVSPSHLKPQKHG